MIPLLRRRGHPLLLVSALIGASLTLLLAGMYFLLR